MAWNRLAVRYLTAPLLWAFAGLMVACGGGDGSGGGGGDPTVGTLFQTTFDCPEWNQTLGLGDADVCNDADGIEGNGGWSTIPGGAVDQITSAANNPAGGGGRGFRHWVGDGLNNGGGGIVISWPPVSEMWLRYYVRFQPGFAWDSDINMKTIYCNRGIPGTFYFGAFFGVIGGHVDDDPIDHGNGTGNHLSILSWSDWQGGPTGNGNFHVLEVHAKMNTTGASSNGVLQFWLDDALIYSSSNVMFSSTTGAQFTNCAVGENHNTPQNGADAYVDFDDIAVSLTGYIGP